MATAQVSAMSVHEIAAQLESSFAVLTRGRRTAPPRHRTLRTTIEWSYNLLNESERILLFRLSVFADGCTADAAKAVCSDLPPMYPPPRVIDVLPLKLFCLLHPPNPCQTAVKPDALSESAVLTLLLQLVHKSLVVADTRTGHTRYRLLETIRQFAIE
jgi:predicted ATPase